LDISRELFFSKDLNIVMEGVSDYYYSQAMLEFIRKNDSKFSFPTTISFIPCMGHTTIGLIVSLLMGMDLKFKVMLDRKDTKKSINKLKNHGLTEEQILVVGKDDNDSIEELFSKEDQEQFQIIKQDKSKALISRIFYEKVKSGDYKDFSPTTKNNFRTLFDELKKEIHSIEKLEKDIDQVEDLWNEVAELLTVTRSLPISQAERKKLITKFSKKIKSLKEPSSEQKSALFNQFLQELGVQ